VGRKTLTQSIKHSDGLHGSTACNGTKESQARLHHYGRPM